MLFFDRLFTGFYAVFVGSNLPKPVNKRSTFLATQNPIRNAKTDAMSVLPSLQTCHSLPF